MKYIKYIIIAYFAALLCSCNGFLDVVPKGKVIPKTTADFDGMVRDPIHVATLYPLVDISSDNAQILETSYNTALNSPDGRAYFWQNYFYKDTEDDSGWKNAYSVIYTMNIVIENIMNSTEGTQEDKNRIMAEAKVNRAYNHWIMLSQFGKAYNKETAKTDLAAPLMLEANLEAVPSRATVEQMYDSILSDLDINPEWLPINGDNNYRIERASLYGLKARVLFYKGEYDLAAVEANKALKINNNLVDYNTFYFINPSRPTSSSLQNRFQPIFSPETIMYRSSVFGSLITTYNISEHLENLYGGLSDLRLKYNFTDIMRNGKPTDDGKKRYLHDLDYSITVPELLLITAEALARKQDNQALTIINTLREKRINKATYTPIDKIPSGKTLLSLVLEERERELPFHGLRWFDMKRLAEEGIYTNTLIRTNNVIKVKLEPKSNLYVFPIADKIIKLNPNIVQNQRK